MYEFTSQDITTGIYREYKVDLTYYRYKFATTSSENILTIIKEQVKIDDLRVYEYDRHTMEIIVNTDKYKINILPDSLFETDLNRLFEGKYRNKVDTSYKIENKSSSNKEKLIEVTGEYAAQTKRKDIPTIESNLATKILICYEAATEIYDALISDQDDDALKAIFRTQVDKLREQRDLKCGYLFVDKEDNCFY